MLALCAGARLAGAETLRDLRAIHALSAEEIAAGLPVELEAVVTFSDPNYSGLFVHDSTAGIYVKTPRRFGRPPPHTRLRIKGVTGSGEFAPIIAANDIVEVGEARFPAARPVVHEELITGLLTSQWVEVTGIVRAATPAQRSGLYLDPPTGPGRELGPPILDAPQREPGLFLDLALIGGRLRGFVSRPQAIEPEKLVGARVRVRGVCASRFNATNQFRGHWLSIPSAAEIDVVEPAADSVPAVSIRDLLRYASEASAGSRVRLRGIVTASPADEETLFIADQGVGLQVRAVSKIPVRRGDEVEVTGFAAIGQFKPFLEDATFRRTGRIGPLTPVAISATDALRGPHDATYHDSDLVRVTAQLVRRVRNPAEQMLVLKADNVIFNAYLPEVGANDRLAKLRDGSVVDVTGVCVVQKSENWNPSVVTSAKAFHLQLDSPADIVVVQEPAWWTLPRLLWAVGILTVTIILALAWVAILRRRVREQTQIIEEKVRHAAVTEERTRIAREFHDTIEQELAAITMQLDAVDAHFDHTPQTARSLLTVARNMGRRSFAEVRRSVWDLRSHLLEQHDLPTALREALRPLTNGRGPEITTDVEGRVVRLPVRIETHLLRIGQEAVTNAVKHGRATRIELVCRYGAGKFQLRIRDDGRGFDTNMALSVSGGHFGLLDMQERAEKIGARFVLHSVPGEGTEIVVTLHDRPPPPERNVS